MEDKKLFLLDAYALIYRAYYALIRSPRITSTGFNSSAVFGFCNTLGEVLRKENPTHIAVCFDPHGPTFRHEMYPEYKAQREAQPEDISLSVPVIKEIIAAYGIPVFEIPGYEADDVIGTLAVRAAAEGYTVYMMTPDKDYGQLVTDRILQYRPPLRGQDFEIRGPQEVCARYGISSTTQIIDLLALEGDTIDNIPGCPGVGPKTAAKLIAEYGSVAGLLAHAAEIKGALGQKIRDNAAQIEFSRELATIRTDVPVEVDFGALRRTTADEEALAAVYRRMEFKTFLQRMGQGTAPAATVKRDNPAKAAAEAALQPSLFDFIDGEAQQAPAQDAAGEAVTEWLTVESVARVAAEVERLAEFSALGIALYATGEEAMTAILRGIAFSGEAGKAVYFPLPDSDEERRELIALLQPLFTNPAATLSSHDIKRDMVLLRRFGIELSAGYFDVSLAHYILQPEMRHRMPDIVGAVLSMDMPQPETTATQRKAFAPYPAGTEARYTALQADMCLRLRQPLEELLRRNGQMHLLTGMELPLARVLAAMEWAGVRVDSEELASQARELSSQLAEIEEQAYELAGERFNLSSPMQVGEILFGKLGLDKNAKRTKKGGYSTTEEVLEKHRASHPVVGLILRARALKKLLTTYVEALPQLVNPSTGKIHTTFNQTVTATGRISSANPNLQNIPVRTEEGRRVRRAFIADPGCVILSADYSQIELRLLANMSGDPELTGAFLSGEDIHRATASKIYHVPLDEVTDTQRRNAKTANFGTIYGISAFGLSERLGIPRNEAKELIDGYFATYPHIREHIARSVDDARRDGFVSTLMGRKRFLPDINSRNATVRSFAERNAVNAPLQGTAADIIKLAMVNIYRRMNREGFRSQMIMQVHDELIFNVVPEELPRLQALVTELMENACNAGPVPLEVSSGVGDNWLEAH